MFFLYSVSEKLLLLIEIWIEILLKIQLKGVLFFPEKKMMKNNAS